MDEETKAVLRRLYRVVDLMRNVDATMPMQTFAALLTIAIEDGLSVSEIGEKIGIAQSSASRNIATLSDWDYTKKTGLKLVEYQQDRMNMTKKTVHLSKTGSKLILDVIAALKGKH